MHADGDCRLALCPSSARHVTATVEVQSGMEMTCQSHCVHDSFRFIWVTSSFLFPHSVVLQNLGQGSELLNPGQIAYPWELKLLIRASCSVFLTASSYPLSRIQPGSFRPLQPRKDAVGRWLLTTPRLQAGPSFWLPAGRSINTVNGKNLRLVRHGVK